MQLVSDEASRKNKETKATLEIIKVEQKFTNEQLNIMASRQREILNMQS